jgi:hypothetical protein
MQFTKRKKTTPNTSREHLFSDLDSAVKQTDPEQIDTEAANLLSLLESTKEAHPQAAAKMIGYSLGVASVWSVMNALDTHRSEHTLALAREIVDDFPNSASPKFTFRDALSLVASDETGKTTFSDALDIVNGINGPSAPDSPITLGGHETPKIDDDTELRTVVVDATRRQ